MKRFTVCIRHPGVFMDLTGQPIRTSEHATLSKVRLQSQSGLLPLHEHAECVSADVALRAVPIQTSGNHLAARLTLEISFAAFGLSGL